MDEIDASLIAMLREDARTPAALLSRRLGLSRTTVQHRIDRLERRGVISGYTLRLSDEFEQGLIKAQVMIVALPKLSAQVEAALRAIREVRALHSLSGSYDMVALIAAASIREMDGLIDRIGALDGVERTMSSIILSTKFER